MYAYGGTCEGACMVFVHSAVCMPMMVHVQVSAWCGVYAYDSTRAGECMVWCGVVWCGACA